MKFEDAVESAPTYWALKRVASAHVVDYKHLDQEELEANVLKTKKQYTHPEAVEEALEQALYLDNDLDKRVLAELILLEVLLNEYGHLMTMEELEEKVVDTEQNIVNQSNENDLKDLAGGSDSTQQYRNLSLYHFVLNTAWEHRDTKSVDEANLLRKLRRKLGITDREHRLLEAKLGKYPKPHNDLHTKEEIRESIKRLEELGLAWEVRNEKDTDFVVIPEEIAEIIKHVLNLEMRRSSYCQLLQHKNVRLKSYLRDVLSECGISYSPSATRAELQQRVAETVRPSVLLGGTTPQGGLNTDTLRDWCAELGLAVGGTKSDRIERIIEHYDELELYEPEEGDEREVWYRYFCELASRDYDTLRAQHVIEKDSEVERRFEDATSYLFEAKLNHTPLKQASSEHSDGLLSFRDTYIMWDNKSSETEVRLKDHIRQFDAYIQKSDKPVPVFLVIGPKFTPDSEAVARQYTAEHIGTNIVLVQAGELKELAELWSAEENKRKADPFPLGLFAQPGRFYLDAVRSSIS